MPGETRVVGHCNRCGAPVYVQSVPGAGAAEVQFSCGHE